MKKASVIILISLIFSFLVIQSNADDNIIILDSKQKIIKYSNKQVMNFEPVIEFKIKKESFQKEQANYEKDPKYKPEFIFLFETKNQPQDQFDIGHEWIRGIDPECKHLIKDFQNSYITEKDDFMVFHISIKYRLSKNQYQKAIDRIENIIGANSDTFKEMDDYQKIQWAYEYIIRNVDYQEKQKQRHNVFGAAILNKATCGGYSIFFNKIMSKLGIETEVIIGAIIDNNTNAFNGAHMWNITKLDNVWYHIDLTNDDIGKDNISPMYDFFLVTDSEMKTVYGNKETLIWDKNSYPKISEKRYFKKYS